VTVTDNVTSDSVNRLTYKSVTQTIFRDLPLCLKDAENNTKYQEKAVKYYKFHNALTINRKRILNYILFALKRFSLPQGHTTFFYQ